MALAQFLHELDADAQFSQRITHWGHLAARPARYVETPPGIDPRLVEALRRRGIVRLYTHQALAAEVVLRGENAVVVTPTASGKTLCYNLPVLGRLLAEPGARALYLFPAKALAQDQLSELQGIARELPPSALGPLPFAVYDGDTRQGDRAAIRTSARVVISNPDMLHAGILPHHTRWMPFFQGLRYVVLDEIHTYRGVFGSHVANVLRRLKRICSFYGAAPRFICSSATIANPQALAEKLAEEPFTQVGRDDDGSPSGEKHLLFYNPPIVDRDLGIRRSAVDDARILAERLLEVGVQTIVFAQSRLVTELLVTYLRDAARREGLPQERVQGYRGGYLSSERRQIERGLREQQVLSVVATNALELGINIGGMDACIMAGYPGTIASTWQQSGRAGRRAGTSLALLVAGASPLDQYIVSHPDYFFGRSPEQALLNPDNLAIAVNHVRCASFELPFEEGESLGRFPHTQEVLTFLEEEGILRHSRERWHWTGETYPAEGISLRTAEMDNFVVVDSSRGGTVIGMVDRPGVPHLLYEGAVYLHGGESYLVDRLDWEGRRAEVSPLQAGYYTQAAVSESVHVTETYDEQEGPATLKAHGAVRITTRASGYKKIRLYTHEVLGYGDISPESIPDLEMDTTAYWFSILAEPAARLAHEGLIDMARGDRGPNWEDQRTRARERDGRICRHCGAPERPDRAHDVHHLEPFAAYAYVRGQNDAYLEANRLENLITLCRSCHQRVEESRMVRGALAGLAHVLRGLAPLYLMSASRDIGVVAEVKSTATRLPTITIYDAASGGLGFSEVLFGLHDTLLAAAADLVRSCRCRRGCPSCVGAGAESGGDAKATCLQLLEIMGVA
ncbi:MAG TPA: DEAD/DEAH box helicase [Anaerolineae bacterium]|nr:DEAD/DEAH box helicase [Anaerolineae bacterium]